MSHHILLASAGIDNRCSVCTSHVKSDFIGELQETTVAVTGFHGTEDYQMYRGTIKWRLEDDDGIAHDIIFRGRIMFHRASTALSVPNTSPKVQREGQLAPPTMTGPFSNGTMEK
jgi:hypothetical protein